MSKLIRFGLLATAAVAIFAWAPPAAAVCGGAGKQIQNYPSAGACGYYCQMSDPGAGIATVKGKYWVIGAGVDDGPQPCTFSGGGTDSGVYAADGTCGTQPWLATAPDANHLNVSIGTDAGKTDGCPLPGQNVAVMFSDANAANTQAFFGINIAQMNAAAIADLGVAGSLTLQPLPKPTVAFVSKAGPTLTLNLNWTIPPGMCIAPSGDSTSCGQVIQGWDIYKREDSKLAPVGDNSRARTNWTLLQSVGNVSAASVSFACTTTTNNVARLSLVPRLDSGFKPDFVGTGSTRVECDPTIADPSGKFKIIDKKAPLQPKK